MRRAFLCGVLILAGCGPPTSGGRAEGPAHPDGLSSPTAEQARRRDAQRGGREADGPAAPELIPDPVYTPREEDRAALVAEATPGFSRASLIDDFYEPPAPGGRDRLREMIDRGEVVELAGKLPVLVLRNLDPADAREPGRHYGVEVRVLAGVRAGEAWFVDESAIARLVPRVVHPSLTSGSYATTARAGVIAYAGWEAPNSAPLPPGELVKLEAFRLEEGARVVVLENRGEAVRVRVHSGSEAVGRVGVVARADLRPMVPPSSPASSWPAVGR